MKKIILTCLIILFVSCDYFGFKTSQETKTYDPIVATVNDVDLYLSELENVVPKDFKKQDSLVLVKNYINSWAKKQLLLKKAEENISEENISNIKKLVKDYQESLLINTYKERLIKQKLDTVILADEVLKYYLKNKENFKLNEELLQLKYVYFGHDFLDKKETIEMFKSDKDEDLEKLEDLTINFKDYQLQDSTWVAYDKVLLKIPPFLSEPKEKLLKISKFIQKEDSLGVYLVAVKKVLKRNDVAPLSYAKNNIKQLILHNRKLELIREIEKTIINDAIKKNNFKEY